MPRLKFSRTAAVLTLAILSAVGAAAAAMATSHPGHVASTTTSTSAANTVQAQAANWCYESFQVTVPQGTVNTVSTPSGTTTVTWNEGQYDQAVMRTPAVPGKSCAQVFAPFTTPLAGIKATSVSAVPVDPSWSLQPYTVDGAKFNGVSGDASLITDMGGFVTANFPTA